MDRKEKKAMYLHWIMSFIGGFVGCYSIVTRCEIFASAQTSNLMYTIFDFFSGDFINLAFRFMVFAAYVLGVAFIAYLEKKSKKDVQIVSIFVSIIMVLIVGSMPSNANVYITLTPVFFATAAQWHAFKGAYGFNSSTIFSSNNLRQATTALVDIYINKEEKSVLKFNFFGGTLLSFHIGVLISYALSLFFNTYTIWFCIIPLFGALCYKTSFKFGAFSHLVHFKRIVKA